jgi:protein-S-isoprenylcysteine O-methyltransferase Ste14
VKLMDRVEAKEIAKMVAVMGAWLVAASLLTGCVTVGYSRMGGGGMGGGWFMWPGGLGLVLVVVVILLLVRRR